MTLSEQRLLFTQCLGKLLTYAAAMQILAVIDETKRTQAEAAQHAQDGSGIANSLHILGLAVDLLLYRRVNGDLIYLSQGTETEYAILGKYWKSLNLLCCWGGDFSKPDWDHFSSTRGGIK